MAYAALKQNIIDQIMEEQAKLGFDEKEIRLYYPLSSLCHITGKKMDTTAMDAFLQGFAAHVPEMGPVYHTVTEERFCFHIPAQGVKWVHDHTPENTFIRKLVQLVVKPGCTMDDIQHLFEAYGTVHVQPMDSDEFDTLMCFENGPDAYYYCFQDDGFDIRYHRFLPGDYADFGY